MKKSRCGLISYSYQGSDYLLALGGEGGYQQLPTKPDNFGSYITNEVHNIEVIYSSRYDMSTCKY